MLTVPDPTKTSHDDDGRYKYRPLLLILSALLALAAAAALFPGWVGESGVSAPPTVALPAAEPDDSQPICSNRKRAQWREAQQIDGVSIAPSLVCEPDNPDAIAAFVKGTDRISMGTLMGTRLAQDLLTKSDDRDGDGDPDLIHLKLEVIELNGSTPEGDFLLPTYEIAPGIEPGLWLFAPKTRGMAIKQLNSKQAQRGLRAPSPVIRVEQGDTMVITLIFF